MKSTHGLRKELSFGARPAVHALRQTTRPGPGNPTTSFLTATTLIYAIGAGITAAAGTRLALQLILDRDFQKLKMLNS